MPLGGYSSKQGDILTPMDTSLITANLLNPPVLFFFAGLLAVRLGSDLEIPQPLPKFFSLYLLLSIGFRGGVELSHSGINLQISLALLSAIGMAIFVPAYSYLILRRTLTSANAAAVAATYGSVSAVTFIAGTSLLTKVGVDYGGHMVAALALMECPAIMVAVIFYRLSQPSTELNQTTWKRLLRESFLNGSVYLLVASMVIGIITGNEGEKALKPFVSDQFKGMLCLFLLDMGLISARRLKDLRGIGYLPLIFATVVPLANAAIGTGLAWLIGLGVGDAFLFCVLCASASYIAVPAAMRLAIPDANPGIYVTMALGLTFPLNVMIGLPCYLSIITKLWG